MWFLGDFYFSQLEYIECIDRGLFLCSAFYTDLSRNTSSEQGEEDSLVSFELIDWSRDRVKNIWSLKIILQWLKILNGIET